MSDTPVYDQLYREFRKREVEEAAATVALFEHGSTASEVIARVDPRPYYVIGPPNRVASGKRRVHAPTCPYAQRLTDPDRVFFDSFKHDGITAGTCIDCRHCGGSGRFPKKREPLPVY